MTGPQVQQHGQVLSFFLAVEKEGRLTVQSL